MRNKLFWKLKKATPGFVENLHFSKVLVTIVSPERLHIKISNFRVNLFWVHLSKSGFRDRYGGLPLIQGSRRKLSHYNGHLKIRFVEMELLRGWGSMAFKSNTYRSIFSPMAAQPFPLGRLLRTYYQVFIVNIQVRYQVCTSVSYRLL